MRKLITRIIIYILLNTNKSDSTHTPSTINSYYASGIYIVKQIKSKQIRTLETKN